MGLFSRNRPEVVAHPPPTSRTATTDTAAEALTDQLLDSLAGMLRTYGNRGFDIEAMSAAELRRRCEAWARHILTGTPAPLGEDWPRQAHSEKRPL
ncbi:MAG: hypothetical protein PVI50_07425, partial [Gammaproteobacteria bacterium]